MAGQIQWRGPTIITDGLVFYMNSSSPSCYNTSSYIEGGNTLRNISGFTSYSGSLTDVSVSTDNNYSGGNIFTFPSSTSRINLGDPTELRFGTRSFTISVWAKPINTNSIRIFACKRNGGIGYLWVGQGSWTGNINPVNSKRINFMTRFNANNEIAVYTQDDIIDGNWKHIVFMRDSSTPELRIYVNNVNQSLTINSNDGDGVLSNMDFIGSPWALGNLDPNGAGYNPNFPISSIQMYNRALSTDELTFNYNNSKALYGL
jgi:hypothetical protein